MKGVYLKKGNTKVSVVPYYRVGDLFLTTIATNPSNFLGGKWELFGPGRCLVCVDTSQTEFNSVKKIGGSKTVTLNVNQIPSHNHGAGKYDGQWMNNGSISFGAGTQAVIINNENHGYRIATSNTGGDQPHNNVQPYITCYVWIRTA